MHRLQASEKLALIKRVHAGEKVSQVCNEARISRTIFYRWLKKYQKAGAYAKRKALLANNPKGLNHWRKLPQSLENQILKVALQNPSFSAQKINKLIKASSFKIWQVLKDHRLNTKQAREIYLERFGRRLINPIDINSKISIMRRFEQGEKVSNLCQEFNISRTVFYRWLKRYQSVSDDQKRQALEPQRSIGEKHWRFIPGLEQEVLKIIQKNPQFSVHKISQALPKKAGKPILSSFGVFTLLKKLNLNTYEKRLRFATSQVQPAPLDRVLDWARSRYPGVFMYISAIPPPLLRAVIFFKDYINLILRILIFPLVILTALAFIFSFTKIFKNILTFRVTVTIVLTLVLGLAFLGIISIVRLIHGVPSFVYSTGYIFALIALTFGMFFFIYSLKYYLSIAIVLAFSRKGYGDNGVVVNRESSGVGGLIPDISNIKLQRNPFVSIHLATYNEKSVLDRLLTATTSQEYENYEVILVDDSTDETLQILNKWQNHPRVKIIHRDTREGFKGGALREALRASSPKTEFVIVFDADFIPYPDTITSFLKYFQATAGQGSNIAAVQGYQWHVLNKSENWITRGVRTEYAGSYVVERSGIEIYQGLKQIAGSVYMIRKDVLESIGWETSITEDFQLTLKLYEKGYKVVFTPYIQAPSECVSTIRRLIRQRMRWAEGHSHNIKNMFFKLLKSSNLTLTEKLEFLYLSPYYLQAAFFIVGTICWFLAEVVFQARLPFWTEVWGWSLILTNLFALPLLNMVGLFLEESDQKDYLGLFSFVALSYIVAPFQGYAAVKGFLAKEEGPWFRTPKTGKITDVFTPGRFYRFIFGVFGKEAAANANPSTSLGTSIRIASISSAFNKFDNFAIAPKNLKWVGNSVLVVFLISTLLLTSFAPFIPITTSYASQPTLRTVNAIQNQTQPFDRKNPANIDTSRVIAKKTKNGESIEFIFHKEPRVRVKLERQEIEFETKMIGKTKAYPLKSNIYGDTKVVYEDILKDIDLVYTIDNNQLIEEFVVKKPSAFSSIGSQIEQTLKTIDTNVVVSDTGTFGFYTKDGKELFKLYQPFVKDGKGEINNDLKFILKKERIGYKLIKQIGKAAKQWLADPQRIYPIVIDPTVVVSGGIEEAEVQFGGLQKKLVYASNAFYAFFNCDANPCAGATGGKIFYKKSTDGGATWGSIVDVDTTDSDNYNPSVWQEGTTLYIAWIDDSADAVEVNTINTASGDALGTKCTSASQGTIGSTFMVPITVADNGTVYFAYSDTGADTEAAVFSLTFSGCTFSNISTPATATTFYLPSSGGADVSPAFDTNWEDQTIATRLKTSPIKASTAMTTVNFADADSTLRDVLFRQYVSQPIAAQTISAQSVRVSQRQSEVGAGNNLFLAAGVYVYSNDGATLRGTVKPMTTRDGTELTTTLTNRSDVVTSTAVTASADDRIVIEVGYGGDPAGANDHDGSISIGDDNGTDLPNDDTTTAANNPVLVFTNAVSFSNVISAGDRPVLVTIGNNLHLVTQDGKLYHSVYNGTDWSTAKSVIASVTDNFYDLTTDNTSLWLLTVSGTTATNFYKCASCPTGAVSWSSQTVPYTGETNLTSVALTYDSSGVQLYAHVIKDASEQAYYKSTAAGTISWSGQTSYAFTAGDLGHISAPMSGAGTSQIGVVVRQGTNFEAAVLPENTLLLLLLAPFLPKVLKKLGKKRKHG